MYHSGNTGNTDYLRCYTSHYQDKCHQFTVVCIYTFLKFYKSLSSTIKRSIGKIYFSHVFTKNKIIKIIKLVNFKFCVSNNIDYFVGTNFPNTFKSIFLAQKSLLQSLQRLFQSKTAALSFALS